MPILGISFFLFDYLYLILFGYDNLSLLPFYLCGSFLMASLIIYQLLFVKKYCLYCIGVSIVVFIKTVFVIVSFNTAFNLSQILISILASSAICSFVLLHKIIERKNFDNEISLLIVKRNPKVINALFHNRQQNLSSYDNVLIYGNPKATTKITTFVDLNCKYCRKVMQDMVFLLKRFPQRFCWNLIIDGFIKAELSEEDFEHINYRQLYIYTLYKKKDKNDFLRSRINIPKKWSCSLSIITQYKALLESIKNLNLNHYPIIIVNDKILPKEYKIEDLQYISTYTAS